jgi:hypothetical protein
VKEGVGERGLKGKTKRRRENIQRYRLASNKKV